MLQFVFSSILLSVEMVQFVFILYYIYNALLGKKKKLKGTLPEIKGEVCHFLYK